MIPVAQTSSTIPPDLVLDTFRLPESESLALIIGQLGAGAGGNGENIAAALDRAIPALTQTNQVLGILAHQNHTLESLAANADTVLRALSDSRTEVQGFIDSGARLTSDVAARQQALAQGFAELPGFLAQLRPAMTELGAAAGTNTPVLRSLDASAGQLDELLENLGPFARVSTPAFAALGRAAAVGDVAVRAATPTIAQLNTFASGVPELAGNLSIVLQHLDDPADAVETEPAAAAQHTDGRASYTGLEALLMYVYNQTLSTNGYDGDGHTLGLAAFVDPQCSLYADVADAREPADSRCHSYLGPTQPGLNAPDPTLPASADEATVPSPVVQSAAPAASGLPASAPAAPATTTTPAAPPGAPGSSSCPASSVCLPGLPPITLPGLQQVGEAIGGLLGAGASGSTTTTGTASTTSAASSASPSSTASTTPAASDRSGSGSASSAGLLNFLLGP